MPDSQSTVAIISASAAIAGVVLTQIITAVNNFFSDRRKEAAEKRKLFLGKKIEIGENFYHTFRESLLNNHRLQKLFASGGSINSKESEEYVANIQAQIKSSSEKLIADTSKYNLTEIYFDIESSSEVTARDINILFDLIIKRLELKADYDNSTDGEKKGIVMDFNETNSKLIDQFKAVAIRIEKDLALVKTELQLLTSDLIK